MKKQNQPPMIMLDQRLFVRPEYYQIMINSNVKHLKVNCFSIKEGIEYLYSIQEFFLNRAGVVERIVHYQYFEPYEYQKATFDENGKKTQAFFYDSDGNLDLKQNFSYDENGNISEILTLQKEEFFGRTTLKFNEKGQEISRHYQRENDRHSGYSQSFYDENDRLVLVKYFYSDETPCGSEFYAYDEQGFCHLYRFESAINKDNATIQKNFFDPNGKILKSEVYRTYDEQIPIEIFQYEMEFFEV